MRSIIGSLGYEDFPRIRIGISDGQRARGEALIGYVMGGFHKQRVKEMEEAITKAADAAECVFRDGARAAMNRYNARSETKGERRGGAAGEKGGADEER
jgi:PTH1 family peptidyl-tRNA hydrolase